MELFDRIKKYENLHILFWLIKDSCWMLEFRWAAALVMVPTLFIAIYIIIKSMGNREVYINTAIFFWILANSFWMMMEFFNNDQYKFYSIIPFSLGFLFVGIFYFKPDSKIQEKKQSSE